MSSTLIASHLVKDLSGNNAYEFLVPDIVKLTGAVLTPGDNVLLPVNLRNNEPTFWETGGRSPKAPTSTAGLIADEEDNVPEAMLFNKLSRQPNGKQALVQLKPGYRLYIGKLGNKNALAPKIRILRLIYQEMDNDQDGESTLAKFVVDRIFTTYQELEGCIPAERLMDKLFTSDVLRPYYTNGWSVSNISGIKDREKLADQYTRLMSEMVATTHYTDAKEFLDAVEDELVGLANPKLSSVFQWVDFDSGVVGVKTLKAMRLANIPEFLPRAVVTATFTIDLEVLFDCYNPNIIFHSNDRKMLELALAHDHDEEGKYALRMGDRIYGLLRGWRG